MKDPNILKDVQLAKEFLLEAIKVNGLTQIGELFHSFDGSGYTGVICLTESHISIHTWPEYNRVTFDVFLSNYMKYNDDIAEKIHEELLNKLEAVEINVTRLNR